MDPTGHLCEAGAEQIRARIDARTATRREVKDLSSYDRIQTRTNNNNIFGPYYEDAMRRHAQNPEWYSHPDESRIVQGAELAAARLEYDRMKARGQINAGHHVQGLAFGGSNTNGNITYTGESTISRNKLTEEQQTAYINEGYTKKRDYKQAKITENITGNIEARGKTYSFGLNEKHTEVTNFQNRILDWQREYGLRERK